MAIIAQSCSRKKNTFITRNYHALTTKYNVLFNGNNALEKGKEAVNNQFTENFWDILPVERLEVGDDFLPIEETQNPDFKIAEEKAKKAIQKHSINIEGREKNPQIVNAYLLLGKSRYYDQRFIPALAAFNNILNKFPTSNRINQVKIWREKANIRLNNEEVAIKKLKRLLDQEELSKQDLADATSTLAQAYLNIKAKDSALTQLDIAVHNTKIKNERARYHFIRGQLYNELGKKDSANIEFDKIIDMHRQIPRAYYINAHLQKSFNVNLDDINKEDFEDYLAKLEKNRENRPFLDKIYYRIAEYHKQNGSDSLALDYYNKSLLKSKSSDKQLTAINYETLGDMFFDDTQYKVASAYYDSTLTAMTENTRPYRAIKKKRDNLVDVILYEDIAHQNDSILYVVSLPKTEQLAFYTDLTEQLKAKALEEQLALKQQNETTKNINSNSPAVFNNNSFSNSLPGEDFGNTPDLGRVGNNTTRSSFYFYNTNTVAYGKNEFIRLWGNRKLQNNWRFSKATENVNDTIIENTETISFEDDPKYNPETYLSSLPTKQSELDSIAKERNFAYYQLGSIYKEKFNEYELAQDKLEALLNNKPEERLILPSKYNLYQIYKALGLSAKKNSVKSDIINNYPNTRYAELLLNPNSKLSTDKNSPKYIYTQLYKQFENQEFQDVIDKANVQVKRLEGDAYLPKFEMLKATANGRLHGFEAYKKSLNYLALNYPLSEEGKKAKDIIEKAFPTLEKKDFFSEDSLRKFNIVYKFNHNSGEDIDAFYKKLSSVKDIEYYKLSVSKDVYTPETTLVVIHGLKSKGIALTFAYNLENENDKSRPKITKPHFVIASKNYAVVQRHKNLDVYLEPN